MCIFPEMLYVKVTRILTHQGKTQRHGEGAILLGACCNLNLQPQAFKLNLNTLCYLVNLKAKDLNMHLT